MFTGPTRGGNRGGTGLFKWEDVKEDKYRENYLGHSVNAPVGRWQKGKDLNWYNKEAKADGSAAKSLKDELNSIKQQEADALAAALGFSAGKRKAGNETVTKQEIQRLLKMDAVEEDDGLDKGKGLGFGRTTAIQSNIRLVEEDDSQEEDDDEDSGKRDDQPNRDSTEGKSEEASSSTKKKSKHKNKDSSRKKEKHKKKDKKRKHHKDDSSDAEKRSKKTKSRHH
ncbi:hypothetical protein HDU76_012972 [Blyttiomyces sp. JEL0837]|nr:hypothetical protein HDU76_012972 [Blyttiomyces sp. JEL0837]